MKSPLNNFYVINEPQSRSWRGRIPPLINKILKRLDLNYEFKKKINPFFEMATTEQRINYYHLLSSVISEGVEGEVVELGCFNGQCAVLFQQILDSHHSEKEIHLFDSFETKFSIAGDVQEALIKNFRDHKLKLPVIHKGFFEETLPDQLPPEIAFAHIDCGFGGDPLEHMKVVYFCLEQLYRKMGPGAICVLMDYHDRSSGDPGIEYNPGVKLACDEFFSDKPEQIICIYGGESSHAYFKKL